MLLASLRPLSSLLLSRPVLEVKMSRRRLDSRSGLAAVGGGLLAESHTPISAEPLDAVFEVTGELGR